MMILGSNVRFIDIRYTNHSNFPHNQQALAAKRRQEGFNQNLTVHHPGSAQTVCIYVYYH
jgi:hypothetical protein